MISLNMVWITTMSNILVTGTNGQLGSEIKALHDSYPYTFFFTDRGSLDTTDAKAIENFIESNKIDCQVNPIETKEYPTPATRPHYSLLNKSKIKQDFGITIPYWKDSLDECLKTLGERK